MAETDQLSSMPLSQIAIDDSSPHIVHYGMHVPVAASTPQGSLYPTLSSLSSGAVTSDTEVQSLRDKV